MNCFKRIVRIAAIFAILISLSYFTSCTKVDDLLGWGLIPNDQKVTLRVDTLTSGIDTYQTRVDSVRSSRLSTLMIGKSWSDIYGGTEAGAFVQYLLDWDYSFRKNPKDYYGFNPSIDSVFINLPITNAYGDTTTIQQFSIYEVTTPIIHDSVYYSNLDPKRLTNMTELFTFSFDGGKKAKRYIKLFDSSDNTVVNTTAAGRQFLDRLIKADTANYKANKDSVFLANFSGLYIAPTPSASKNGAVYFIRISNENDYGAFTVHGHNMDKEHPQNVKDTLMAKYIFEDRIDPSNYGFYYNYASSINVLKRDYKGSLAEVLLQRDTTATSPTSTVTYIDGPCGLQTYMRFTDQLVETLRAFKTNDGEYRSIMINKAVLITKLDNPGIPYLNAAPARLGMYYKNFVPIPDFTTSLETDGYILPYDGFLNRNHGYYTMDITSFLQQIIKDEKGEVKRTIHMGMPYESSYVSRQVAMKGTGDLKLVVTYSLIK